MNTLPCQHRYLTPHRHSYFCFFSRPDSVFMHHHDSTATGNHTIFLHAGRSDPKQKLFPALFALCRSMHVGRGTFALWAHVLDGYVGQDVCFLLARTREMWRWIGAVVFAVGWRESCVYLGEEKAGLRGRGWAGSEVRRTGNVGVESHEWR
ncbi:hypothetical protein IQ06DRAFT_23494 [Phaeosphaeriaceae sp. SRC1lsM3a]|nr:hypothetical protein IQ06DRAFT_23494 [Stagonospora sp. SRC1lsM3a]